MPLIGELPVSEIDPDTVRRVLEPIWNTKAPTASLVRGRLEVILTFATVSGWRSGPNPALWRGNLQALLPATSILTAARCDEALSATWNEIDDATATWTIPAARMKTRKVHRVPLSKPTLELLQRMKLVRRADNLIFPGLRPGKKGRAR